MKNNKKDALTSTITAVLMIALIGMLFLAIHSRDVVRKQRDEFRKEPTNVYW